MEENIVTSAGAALRKNLRKREGQFDVSLRDICKGGFRHEP